MIRDILLVAHVYLYVLCMANRRHMSDEDETCKQCKFLDLLHICIKARHPNFMCLHVCMP